MTEKKSRRVWCHICRKYIPMKGNKKHFRAHYGGIVMTPRESAKEGLKQRIEKIGDHFDWLGYGSECTCMMCQILRALDKTKLVIKALPRKGGKVWVSLDDVLKALNSNPLERGSNPKTPKFGLKEANQPTGKFIKLDSEEGEE